MCHTSKNLVRLKQTLKKWFTLRKMSHTWKIGSAFEKQVALKNDGSHLEKWARLGKMGHTWKNRSQLEKWVTYENEFFLEKCVKLGKMRKTWKNESHLKKWLTLEETAQPIKDGSKWDSFFQVRPIFPDMTHFSKFDPFFQVWAILPSVRATFPSAAHFSKCYPFQVWKNKFDWLVIRSSNLRPPKGIAKHLITGSPQKQSLSAYYLHCL